VAVAIQLLVDPAEVVEGLRTGCDLDQADPRSGLRGGIGSAVLWARPSPRHGKTTRSQPELTVMGAASRGEPHHAVAACCMETLWARFPMKITPVSAYLWGCDTNVIEEDAPRWTAAMPARGGRSRRTGRSAHGSARSWCSTRDGPSQEPLRTPKGALRTQCSRPRHDHDVWAGRHGRWRPTGSPWGRLGGQGDGPEVTTRNVVVEWGRCLAHHWWWKLWGNGGRCLRRLAPFKICADARST
jgi:hypothetical protein